jgi:hypothetical protein
VRDREETDSEPLVVIARPAVPCNEWEIPPGGTVASDNPEYPDTAPVVVAMFESDLAAYLPEWKERGGPLRLSRVAESDGVYYSYPEPRLELVDPAESILHTDGVAEPGASEHTINDDESPQ